MELISNLLMKMREILPRYQVVGDTPKTKSCINTRIWSWSWECASVMNVRILTSCNVLTNFKARKKLKICLIEPTIEAFERRTIMEPISFTNTPGTPITKENFKKVSLSAKPITKYSFSRC